MRYVVWIGNTICNKKLLKICQDVSKTLRTFRQRRTTTLNEKHQPYEKDSRFKNSLSYHQTKEMPHSGWTYLKNYKNLTEALDDVLGYLSITTDNDWKIIEKNKCKSVQWMKKRKTTDTEKTMYRLIMFYDQSKTHKQRTTLRLIGSNKLLLCLSFVVSLLNNV